MGKRALVPCAEVARGGFLLLSLCALALSGCSGGAEPDSGGAKGSGGSQAAGGSGAAPATGGSRGEGGVTASGGKTIGGGGAGTGGAQGSGGTPASGGVPASGGSRATGGAAGLGGAAGSGGAPATGGTPAAGGTTSSGGSSTTTSNRDAGTENDVPLGGSDAADAPVEARKQAPRPDAPADSCGAWAMTEGVCCAQYCSDDDKSESCDKCGGPGAAKCQVVNAKACTSGQWPEVHQVTDSEDWHYSRSTHFGTAPTGACAFGLYGLCTSAVKLANTTLQGQCDTFCKAYPDLCKDPAGITLRGNFTAPQGNYYTQFWSSLPGDLDNYLSCGECFQIERTQDDGAEYTSGASGYTSPIVMTVADSCPCSANSKWCCGSGRDHCGEIKGVFKYGCQLPPSPPDPPLDHDPLPGESMHFDLDDIAMARLQTGDANGTITDGVIPTKYKRVPCPVVGNVHIGMQPNPGPYYFALTVVNMAGLGAAAKVEAQLPSGEWVMLIRNANYSLSRPQEHYATWVMQSSAPFQLPVTLRITDGGGRTVVATDVIKSFTPPDGTPSQNWFIDTGVQF